MATACQQASFPSLSYEVFLSFHGKDVRTSFADHLYHALVGAGIRTFRDNEELSKGEELAPNLLTAVQQSVISIPILSMSYASSRWCLNELNEIFECRRTRNQLVLPIFYKIEPKDVRNQTGAFAKAFEEEHPKCFDEPTVQKWRVVLQEIGKLDGWHFKEDMHEAKLVKEIVKVVSSTLNKRLVHVSDNLVGIKSHVEKVLEKLEINSEVTKIVGIHGFGGIGKTTIARAVSNTILNKFEEYAFIDNVREDARKFGIPYLQNKLITTILKDGSQNIIDVDTGIKVIKQRLCTKKVLVVLDDVDQDIQLESLIGGGEWFGNGSRIIITSRNKDTLITQRAGIYEPDLMNLDDSLELFSRYAFKKNHPQEDYLDLSKAMVKVAGRLPLALKVIGSSLFSKKKPAWESMLKKLQKVPNNDVMERLKISYDGLESAEQQMFLDTACFFIGMKKDIVCHVWDACDFYPQVGLDALCAKSLITISEDGKLRMHDVLRDLGRDIVRRESIKPGECSRIWSKEDVLDVLIKYKGTNKCVGLAIDFKQLSIDFNSKSKSGRLMSDGLDSMTEIRLLQLDYAQILGNCNNSFSELRWLSWKGCLDQQYALTSFCPEKLVVLDLSNSEITENWMGWNYIKMAVNLKVLKLESCQQLQSTPDFSGNQLLEVLSLENCENLIRVDTSVGHLKNLVTLDMEDCKSLVDLPVEICELASLETLLLYGCWSLNKIPDKWEVMTTLKALTLSCNHDVPSLPPGLTSIDFYGCKSLQNISSLPQNLTSIDFCGCHSLQNLSNPPSSLITLRVSFCGSLQNIMLNFPSSLTSLSVRDCGSVRLISGLPLSLRSLEVYYCKSVVKISSASGGYLRNLEALKLDSCLSLEEIEGLEDKLESLEQCEIRNCCVFKRLPIMKGSINLLCLKISENYVMSGFVGEGMNSLEELKIMDCKSFKKLPYLRDSKQLRELHIRNCPELMEIEGLEGYESLQELFIREAPLLKTLLEDISTLKNLRDLYIGCCKSLEKLPDLSSLKELRKLTIWNCEKLSEIGGLYGLESLQELHIKACKNLSEIHLIYELKPLQSSERLRVDHSNLKKLRNFEIKSCDNLSEILGLDKLESLEELKIRYCNNLAEIHGLHRLKRLKSLTIIACCSLERLPDLSNLKELRSIWIEACDKLSKISGLEKLESLHEMAIRRCNNLTEIKGLKD